MSNWPVEHDEALKTLHAEGYSYMQIASALCLRFGASYTRNAVVGRAFRLKLPKVEKATAIPKREPEREISVIPPFPDEPRLGPLHLVDLGPNDCKYPFGDRDFTFCAKRQQDDSPYCPEHTELCQPTHSGGVRR